MAGANGSIQVTISYEVQNGKPHCFVNSEEDDPLQVLNVIAVGLSTYLGKVHKARAEQAKKAQERAGGRKSKLILPPSIGDN